MEKQYRRSIPQTANSILLEKSVLRLAPRYYLYNLLKFCIMLASMIYITLHKYECHIEEHVGKIICTDPWMQYFMTS